MKFRPTNRRPLSVIITTKIPSKFIAFLCFLQSYILESSSSIKWRRTIFSLPTGFFEEMGQGEKIRTLSKNANRYLLLMINILVSDRLEGIRWHRPIFLKNCVYSKNYYTADVKICCLIHKKEGRKLERKRKRQEKERRKRRKMKEKTWRRIFFFF